MVSLPWLLLVLAQSKSPMEGFGKFVDRDLRSLKDKEYVEWCSLRDVILPKQPLFAMASTQPLWIKSYHVDSAKWLFMATDSQHSVPSVAFIHAATLDEKLATIARYDFSIGYRMWLFDSKLVADPLVGQPIVKFWLRSQGPFIVSGDGKVERPAFHPASGVCEWYVFDRDGCHLIRVESGDGNLLSNNYSNMMTLSVSDKGRKDLAYGKFLDMGPSVAGRTATEWKTGLDSAEPVRILSCLTWLAGTHRKPDVSENQAGQENSEDFKVFHATRSSQAVIDRIKSLTKSPNDRIRSQATFTLEKLEQPIE